MDPIFENAIDETGRLSVEIWRPYAFAALIGLARMLGVIAVLPMLSQLGLRGVIRFTVAAGLSTPIVLGLVGPVAAAEIEPLTLLALMVKETLVGVGVGLLLGLPFWAASLAGSAIDMQRMAASAITAAADGSETSVIGLFIGMIYIAFVFATGAHLLAIEVVWASFSLWPALSLAPRATLEPSLFLPFLQDLFTLGLLLVAPIIFVLLLSDVAIAVLSRFAPNMNAMLLAMQVKSLIISGMLLLCIGVFFALFSDQLDYFVDLRAALGGG